VARIVSWWVDHLVGWFVERSSNHVVESFNLSVCRYSFRSVIGLVGLLVAGSWNHLDDWSVGALWMVGGMVDWWVDGLGVGWLVGWWIRWLVGWLVNGSIGFWFGGSVTWSNGGPV
jgi:rhodanese-related sulfurtransferase